MDTRKDQDQGSLPGAMVARSLEPEMLGMDEATGMPEPGNRLEQNPPTPLQESFRRLLRDKRAMFSMGLILLFILIAIVGPFIYQHIGGPYVSNVNAVTYGPQDYHNFSHEELDRQNEMPSAQYWLGTDELGRDILARLMQGILVSIMVAVIVTRIPCIRRARISRPSSSVPNQ